MRCRSVLTRIDAMRTGELPSDEHAPLHDHLKTCRSCDDSVADVTQLARVVRALTVEPPRSCRDAVCSQIGDSFARVETGAGDVWVAFCERGLRMVHRAESEQAFRDAYTKRYGRPLEKAALPDRLRKQVVAAVEGHGVEGPLVDFDEVSELEGDVLRTLTRIPRGEVRTYAWVAEQIGRPKAVRAVGTICAKNAVPFVVPCHRVVPSTGGVGQYAFGAPVKRDLLRREGVDVDALDALARKGVRLIGSRTTKIVCFPTCKDARRIREENRVPFHAADEAMAKGFRPCRRCQPFAA
jgi:methylated-DNA-[protein]-cysteine S-methyltransferase